MPKRSKLGRRIISRKVMYSALAFVLISITTMTLAYATLSTTLKITGTAKFKDVNWGITLEELPASEDIWYPEWEGTTNGNTVTIGSSQILAKPTLSGTTLNNYRVSLKKPGDEIGFFYKLTNTGNIPAIVVNAIFSEPIYNSSTNNEHDIEIVHDNFYGSYELYYLYEENGHQEVGNRFTYDILCPGASLMLYLYNGFDIEATEVPSSNVTISSLDAQIEFEAGDHSLCDGSTPIGGNKPH